MVEFSRHTRDYLKTRIKQNTSGLYPKRSEFPTRQIIESYLRAQDILFPNLTCREGISCCDTINIKERLFVFGKIFGVSSMLQIIDELKQENPFEHSEFLNSFTNDSRKSSMFSEDIVRSFYTNRDEENKVNWEEVETEIAHLRELQQKDIEKGYKGHRKANEVTLPNPESWEELNIIFDPEEQQLIEEPFLEDTNECLNLDGILLPKDIQIFSEDEDEDMKGELSIKSEIHEGFQNQMDIIKGCGIARVTRNLIGKQKAKENYIFGYST